MRDFGTVRPGTTLYIPFATYDSNDPSASVTLTGLAVTDIEVYKNGSVTQRSSDNGYALLDTDGIDFDGVTGIHGISIDLGDNSDAGFWAAGAQYTVVVASVTVDAATVNFIAATFRIGYADAIHDTVIATLASQTSFTLAAGPAEDDALNGCVVLIHDVASAVQKGFAVVQDYTGSSKTVTLAAGTTFTAAATDNVSFFPPANVAYFGGVAGTFAAGRPEANTTHFGGSALTQSGGRPEVNLTHLGGSAQSGTDLKDFADDGYDPATNKVEGVKLADTLTAYTGNTPQTGDSFARLGAPAGASVSADVAAVKTDTGNLVTRITAALFSGITSLAQWLGMIAGKQTGDSTARTEMRATGAGSGTFDETTDSAEAIRDTPPLGTAMRGTDSAALASVCTEARLSELDAGTAGKAAAEIDLVKADVAAILVDTGTTLDGRIPAALVGGRMDSNVGSKTVGLALTAQEKADVNAEVLDVVAVDTFAQPGQEAPAATTTLRSMLAYCYKLLRNRTTQTSTQLKIYADDGTTVDQKASVSDDGTTYDRGEIGTGP